MRRLQNSEHNEGFIRTLYVGSSRYRRPTVEVQKSFRRLPDSFPFSAMDAKVNAKVDPLCRTKSERTDGSFR